MLSQSIWSRKPGPRSLYPLRRPLLRRCARGRAQGSYIVSGRDQHHAEALPRRGVKIVTVTAGTKRDTGAPIAGDRPLGSRRNTSHRSSPDNKGPRPSHEPDGPGGPNPGDGMSFQLRYWILLLAEYSGVYGTAAVLIAALTHVDAFGGFHWDPADVTLGVSLMAPALAFDALVGLPDWATRKEDAAAVVRLLLDPGLLQSSTEEALSPSPSGGREGRTQTEQTAQRTGSYPTEEQHQQPRAEQRDEPDKTEDSPSNELGTLVGTATLIRSSAAVPVTSDAAAAMATEASTTSAATAQAAQDAAAARDGSGSSSGSSTEGRVDDAAGLFSSRRSDASGSDRLSAIRSSSAAATTSTSTVRQGTGIAANSTAPQKGGSAISNSISKSGSVGDSSTSNSSIGGPYRTGPLWAAVQRLRMALELMQESSIRNNPGARLNPLQEVFVILAAVTAEEMLYRAVLLTLLGRWLRDRAYEAGADDVLSLGDPGCLQLNTAAAAQWAALGVGLVLGAAVFAAKAWQEATVAERVRAFQAAQAEEASKELRKQRLRGQHLTEEQLRQERDKQARIQAAQASLMASIGVQGALVWLLEGGREVYQVAAAGASFLLTGNLAAPIAGSVVAQLLVSAYQRLGLRRAVQRRAKMMEARLQAVRRQQRQ